MKTKTTSELCAEYGGTHSDTRRFLTAQGIKPRIIMPWGEKTIRRWGKDAEDALKARAQARKAAEAAEARVTADANEPIVTPLTPTPRVAAAPVPAPPHQLDAILAVALRVEELMTQLLDEVTRPKGPFVSTPLPPNSLDAIVAGVTDD